MQQGYYLGNLVVSGCHCCLIPESVCLFFNLVVPHAVLPLSPLSPPSCAPEEFCSLAEQEAIPQALGGWLSTWLSAMQPESACPASSDNFNLPLRAHRSIENIQPTGLDRLPCLSYSHSIPASIFTVVSGSEAIWLASICRSSLFSPVMKSSGSNESSRPSTYVFLFILCVKLRTLQSDFQTPA